MIYLREHKPTRSQLYENEVPVLGEVFDHGSVLIASVVQTKELSYRCAVNIMIKRLEQVAT